MSEKLLGKTDEQRLMIDRRVYDDVGADFSAYEPKDAIHLIEWPAALPLSDEIEELEVVGTRALSPTQIIWEILFSLGSRYAENYGTNRTA
jgi:hypothetical protein